MLNVKKVVIVSILFVIILASVLFLVFKNSKKSAPTLQTFCSEDKTISLSIYDSFEFSKYSDDSYVLAVNSNKINSSIYVSRFSTSNIRDISKFIEADKNDYISKFTNINQVSDISEYTFQGLHAYNYHFNYQENMYVDVYWILKDSDLYVIDFNVNMKKGNFSSHISEILNSLKFN